MIRENEIISKVLLTIDRCKGNLNHFKSSITDNEYTPLNSTCFTRTLVWKVCLITDSLKIQTWDSKLSNSRVVYHQLMRRDDMVIPWWLLEHDSPFFQTQELSRKSSLKGNPTVRRTRTLGKTSLTRVSNVEDPLSAGVSSRSRSSTPPLISSETTEEDVELLQTIILDIDRLFPGEEFFHSSNPHSLLAKRQMIQILYVWAKCNPQVGYKQGIHEILGLMYINLYRESLVIPSTNTISADDLRILSLFDIHYLPHDLFTMLNKFLLQSGVINHFYENENVLWKSIEKFNVYLMKVDQLIHYNLINKLKLESQLWIIRYLRLLLLRELGNDLETTSLLWDKLVAAQFSHHNGNTITAIPDLVMFMIIVLLIQLKTHLITSDFSEALSLLLHYPVPAKFNTEASRGEFIATLYKDAAKLYEKRETDLKLYEYGIKLNNAYNPNLRITMSYTGSARSSVESTNSARASLSPSRSPAPPVSQPPPAPGGDNVRAEQMRFEKIRLEMRLKKRAQSMLRQ
ncbi:rab-GTPase-TBC domain-containing protein [Scheffersomyces xylosifermentans]|uniref:rab-GTPase-TBC domain-containing protein n=1 Tax=Scheffersomyces xylosifermentans TaxID=1304137 RepID=UPI00315D6553